MKTAALPNGGALEPWKPAAGAAPHLTIETNYTCNLRCRSCYNIKRGGIKPLDQVKAEIDRGLELRRADAVTLLGGEPTLHPELPQIIRHLVRRRVTPQLLTNGLRLFGDEGERYLDTLVAAGLVRVLLHIDEGQRHVHPDPLAAIHTLFARFEARRLFFSLSWTVHPENPGAVARLSRELARYERFDGILALLARNLDAAVCGLDAEEGAPTMEQVSGALSSELAIEPAHYFPSSLDDREVSWLMYFYYLNARTGEAVSISPRLTRAYIALYRRLTGREAFASSPSRAFFRPALALTMALDVLLDHRRAGAWRRVLKDSQGGRALRFHYVVIQDAPVYDHAREALRLCYHCPDATVRHGRLVPVCLADRVSPMGGVRRPGMLPGIEQAVYAHMEGS